MELRGVTEDEEFTRQARTIIPDPYLRDEVLSSAYNMLAMFPNSGRSLGNGIRRLVYDVVPLRVTVIILYTVEEQGVTLRDIFEHP